MKPECPQCAGRDTVQISDQQAECLECGTVFSNLATELDKEAA